jgi:signal transduction histidine kinase
MDHRSAADSTALQHTAEQQLDRLESEFGRLKELLRRSQRLASLGTASAMLAHEYNNLFTPVVGYAQHALDRNDPELMRLALEKVIKQTQIITRMSDRILGLAVERDQVPASCKLLAVIEDALGCLGRDLSKDRIDVIIHVDPDLTVRANPHQLEQVLFNLITNARQAMLGRAGRLTIDATPAPKDRVLLSVRDNGPGISEKHIDQVFDPFFTTKRSGRKIESAGIGLGLYICRELVDDNGGTITAASEPGKGATFTIDLPAGT